MMPPDVARRLAGCLRLLTSPFDGERLAAADRINGLVSGYGLDWDQLFGGLSEANMQRLYDVGFEAGRQAALDERKPAEPERDWSIVGGAGGARTVGKQIDRPRAILAAAMTAEEAGLLDEFEVTFTGSMRERVTRYGGSTFVSSKQWTVFNRLEERFRECGFIG
jgi:hypothetical protein